MLSVLKTDEVKTKRKEELTWEGKQEGRSGEGEEVSFFPVAPKGTVGAAEKFLEAAWAECDIISIQFASVFLSRDVQSVLQ